MQPLTVVSILLLAEILQLWRTLASAALSESSMRVRLVRAQNENIFTDIIIETGLTRSVQRQQ